MSTSIDNKIVSLKFDNNQFEQNVKTSMNTLERLKSSLNFDAVAHSLVKGFGNVEQSLSVGGIANSIDGIADRFSAMGIVGATVISNLTTQVMGLAQRLAGLAINPLVEGGKTRALNIEQAKFKLQGLEVEWDKIEDDINYGVRDTAYGLDAAANVAAQLVASNVQLGESMKAALRGVSGVAAMTSSSYEDIGHIFTTVAGQGRLMGMQLTQLSMRGLNVAADLGKALGKTESEIRDMVSKGQIDFATFSRIMNETYGDHAKKANETFTGAMSNTRAALSRIGAKFATPAYENLKDVLNGLIPVINAVNKSLDPFVELAEKGMKKASESLVKAFKNFGKVGDKTKKTAKEIDKLDELAKRVIKGEFGNGEERRKQLENLGVSYDEVQSKVNALLGSTKTTNESTNLLVGIVKNFAEALKNVSTGLETAFTAIKDAFGSVFTESAIERIDVFSEKVSKFSEKFKMSEDTAKKFKATFEGLFGLFKLAETGVLGVIKALTPFANTVSDMIGSSLGGALDKLSGIAGAINEIVGSINNGKTFFENVEWVFGLVKRNSSISGKLSVFGESVKKIFPSLGSVVRKITGALHDLFNVGYDNNPTLIKLALLGKVINEVAETFVNVGVAVAKVLRPIKDAIVDMFPKRVTLNLLDIVTAVQNFTEKLVITDSTAEKIKNTFKGFLAVLNIVGQLFSAVIRTLFPSTNALFKLGGGIATVTGGLGEWLVALSKNLEENDTFYNAIQRVIELIRTGFETAKEKIQAFKETYEEMTGKELKLPDSETLLGVVDTIKEKLQTVPEIFSKVRGWISGFFAWLDEDESGNKQSSIETLVNIISSLSDMIEKSPDFSTFFSNLSEAFGKLDFVRMGKILNIAFFVVFVNALFRLKDALYSLFDWNLYKNINGVASSLKGAFTAFSYDLKANHYIKIAQAVAVLAGSLVALSMVDAKRLNQAVWVLALLFAELTAFVQIGGRMLSRTNMMGFGVMVTGLAVAVTLLANAIARLGKLNPSALLSGLFAVFGLLGALALAVNFIPLGEESSLVKAVVAIAALSAAMVVLSKAIKIVGETKNAGGSLAVLAGALAIIGVFIAIFSTSFPAIMEFSASVLIMSVAMTVLARAVVIFTEALSSFEALKRAGTSIALIAVMMTLLGAEAAIWASVTPGMIAFAIGMSAIASALFTFIPILKALEGLEGAMESVKLLTAMMNLFAITAALWGAVLPQMFVMSISLINLAAALALVTPALIALSAVSIGGIVKALLALAGALVIFAGISVLLAAAIPTMLLLAGAFLTFGIGLVAVGAGLGLMAATLALLSVNLVGITALIYSFGGALLSIVVVVTEVVLAVLSAIEAIIPNVVIVIGKIITAIAKTIADAIPTIVNCGMLLILGILQGINSHIGDILHVTNSILVKLIDGLALILPTLVDAGLRFMIKFINGLAEAIRNNTDAIWGAFKNLFSVVLEFGISVLQSFLLGIPGVGGKIYDALEKVKTGIREVLVPSEMNDNGKDSADALAQGISSGSGAAESAGKSVGSSAFSGLTSLLPDFSSVGESFGLGFGDSLEGQSGFAFDTGSDLGKSSLGGLESLSPDFSSVGESLGIDFSTAFGDTEGLAFDASSEVGDSAFEGLDIDMSSLGFDTGSSYSSGLGKSSGKAADSAASVADNSIEAIDSKYDTFRESGHNSGKGFALGLFDDSRAEVYDSAASLARVALNSMRVTLNEHSPSKETRQIGSYGGEGLSLGLLDMISVVRDAGEFVAQNAMEAMRKPLLRASEILTSDIDVEPTIRPVVDLSDVTRSASMLGGMFSDRTFNVGSLSGELSKRTSLAFDSSASAAEANRKELGNIVRSIGELREDIDALGDKMARMNMVLDTGALVGAIAEPIDNELGRRYRLARRGV